MKDALLITYISIFSLGKCQYPLVAWYVCTPWIGPHCFLVIRFLAEFIWFRTRVYLLFTLSCMIINYACNYFLVNGLLLYRKSQVLEWLRCMLITSSWFRVCLTRAWFDTLEIIPFILLMVLEAPNIYASLLAKSLKPK